MGLPVGGQGGSMDGHETEHNGNRYRKVLESCHHHVLLLCFLYNGLSAVQNV
jgi:hypothetical protein